MRVRCIDNTGIFACEELVLGQIYEVLDTTHDVYHPHQEYQIKIGDFTSWWLQSRFEIVNEEPASLSSEPEKDQVDQTAQFDFEAYNNLSYLGRK